MFEVFLAVIIKEDAKDNNYWRFSDETYILELYPSLHSGEL